VSSSFGAEITRSGAMITWSDAEITRPSELRRLKIL
jgi:hypothetical protein